MSWSDHFGLWMANFTGTMAYVLILLGVLLFWILWNRFAPWKFDPQLNIMLQFFNITPTVMASIVLIGANLQQQHSELRAENDYRTNRKAEREIASLHKKLDDAHAKIDQLLER